MRKLVFRVDLDFQQGRPCVALCHERVVVFFFEGDIHPSPLWVSVVHLEDHPPLATAECCLSSQLEAEEWKCTTPCHGHNEAI